MQVPNQNILSNAIFVQTTAVTTSDATPAGTSGTPAPDATPAGITSDATPAGTSGTPPSDATPAGTSGTPLPDATTEKPQFSHPFDDCETFKKHPPIPVMNFIIDSRSGEIIEDRIGQP